MGVTPQYVGMYGRPWLINLNTDSGTDTLIGVTAANIAITVRNLSVYPPSDTASLGTVTILSVSPAQILWQPTATDYATSGNFALETVVTFPTGPVEYDPILFPILLR